MPALDDRQWEPVDLPHDFMIEGKGQAIVVPGGRTGGGRGAASLPTTPEGPFDPRSPRRRQQRLFERRHRLVSQDVHAATDNAARARVSRIRRHLHERRSMAERPEARQQVRTATRRSNSTSRRSCRRRGSPTCSPSASSAAAVDTLVLGRRHLSACLADACISRSYGAVGRDGADEPTLQMRAPGWTCSPPSRATQAGRRHRLSARSSEIAKAGLSRAQRAPRPLRAASATVSLSLDIPKPHRWSIEDPYLYTVEPTLTNGDLVRVPLGLRTIEFTTEGGFLLNGRRVPIQGVCLHHDLGALGAAAFDRGIERQLEIMKSMGVNAIRTSHNPPAPALLDSADRMGFVVMDEAFDEWNAEQDALRLRPVLRRVERARPARHGPARSQPPERDHVEHRQRDPRAAQRARPARRWRRGWRRSCRDEDPTRPVTAGDEQPDAGARDRLREAARLVRRQLQPRRLRTRDRAASRYALRDVVELQLARRVQPGRQRRRGRDRQAAGQPHRRRTTSTSRAGATPPRRSSRRSDERPWMAGEFVWTGFDYIGEPTPFSWPQPQFSFGIVDLAGFPKDRFYLYQSQWTTEPMVHMLPHWTWPDEFKGKAIPVLGVHERRFRRAVPERPIARHARLDGREQQRISPGRCRTHRARCAQSRARGPGSSPKTSSRRRQRRRGSSCGWTAPRFALTGRISHSSPSASSTRADVLAAPTEIISFVSCSQGLARSPASTMAIRLLAVQRVRRRSPRSICPSMVCSWW